MYHAKQTTGRLSMYHAQQKTSRLSMYHEKQTTGRLIAGYHAKQDKSTLYVSCTAKDKSTLSVSCTAKDKSTLNVPCKVYKTLKFYLTSLCKQNYAVFTKWFCARIVHCTATDISVGRCCLSVSSSRFSFKSKCSASCWSYYTVLVFVAKKTFFTKLQENVLVRYFAPRHR